MAHQRRHERSRARQAALQVLYTSEIQGLPASDLIEGGLVLEDESPLSDYAVRLIEGVDEKMLMLNMRLSSTSENWKLNRMPIVDRCILRLATYEMLCIDEVPVSVSINEAVELAKDFGGEDESPRFVNGVLGRIARQIEEDAKDPEAARRREDEMYAAYAFPTQDEGDASAAPEAAEASEVAEAAGAEAPAVEEGAEEAGAEMPCAIADSEAGAGVPDAPVADEAPSQDAAEEPIDAER